MKLVPVAEHPEAAEICYRLMAEAKSHEVISHDAMPTMEEHVEFMEYEAPRRYAGWYLIELAEGPVGWVYATKRDEIGIRLFEKYQGIGIGPAAIDKLRELHPTARFANVNPANQASISMFEALGFRHIQNTYRLDT